MKEFTEAQSKVFDSIQDRDNFIEFFRERPDYPKTSRDEHRLYIAINGIEKDYFSKFIAWVEEGEGDEDSRTVVKYEIKPEHVKDRQLCINNVWYFVGLTYDEDPLPEGSSLATITISLATKLGLRWNDEDEGEQWEATINNSNYVFKIVAVFLLPGVK